MKERIAKDSFEEMSKTELIDYIYTLNKLYSEEANLHNKTKQAFLEIKSRQYIKKGD